MPKQYELLNDNWPEKLFKLVETPSDGFKRGAEMPWGAKIAKKGPGLL